MAHLSPILYDVARVAGWDPSNPPDPRSTCFLGWICTMQILHNQAASEELGHLDHLSDLSEV